MYRSGLPKPVTIRGVYYPSYKAAAKAFGVDPRTVKLAVERGREDTIGYGLAMPIRIRNVDYPNARFAAEVLGVSQKNIYRAMARDSLDYVGNGQRKPRVSNNGAKPFSIAGLSWPSRQQASIALVFHRRYVDDAVRDKRQSALDKILLAAMRYKQKQEKQNGRKDSNEKRNLHMSMGIQNTQGNC